MASRPIDEKIVVMKLDNSDFANKAADTATRLGRLRDALNRIPGVNLGKTTQELGQIQNAADNTNMGRLATAVQGVASQFSALRVMATTALATVTSMATQTGISMAKSLTLDQVTDGYQEYETKIGAIGTMLANTEWAGSDLDDVKKTLADLGAYADQTVYSFGDMTENIGRFTSAGVKLEDSAIAIKGLGNLAAASGSNTEQLNNAMYQMSQALSAGKIGLEDWNSVVNAGMGGKKFQDALVKTAEGMGKNTHQANGFRMSLQKGWLTSDVMLKTLKEFGNDKSLTKAATSVRTFSALMDSTKEAIGSGWATTFEQIFGDFDESTKLFTALSQSIGGFFNKGSQARNDLLTKVADGGGMQNIFKGIADAAKPVSQVMGAIGDGFRKAFPPATAKQVIEMTKSFKEFTAGLKLSKETVSDITNIFHGVFSVFSSIIIIAKELGGALLNLIPPSVGGGLLDILSNIADLAIGFNESLKAGNGLTKAIGTLGTGLGGVGTLIGGIVTALGSLSSAASEVWNILANGDFTGKGPWMEDSKIVDWLFDIREAFVEVKSILFDGDFLGGGPWEEDSPIVDWLFKIRDAFIAVGDWFKDSSNGIGAEDVLGAGTLVGVGFIVTKIMGFFNNLGGAFEGFQEFLENAGEGVSGILEGLGDSLQAFVSQVKYTNLLKIAIAVGILAVSLKLMEGMDVKDITKGIMALGISLGVMMGAMAIIDKFNLVGGMRATTTIMGLAIAVSIMAGALKKISDLKPSELITGLGGLVGIVAALSLAIIGISKFGGKIKTSSLQLLALAGAIYILADAVKTMSGIDTGSLVKGVAALGVLFLELAIFLKLVNKTKFGPGSAIGLIAVAGAVKMMVSAIDDIAGFNLKELAKGLGTIAIVLAEMALFSRLVSGGSLMAAGLGMIAIAAAMNILIGPIQTFSNMSWIELAKGLGALAVSLGLVAAAALVASGSIGGAIAIGIMAVSLGLLIKPIETLANMTWGELAKGFIALAAGIALVTGASILLSPAIPVMLGFGAALLVVGVAVLAVGAGLGLFAAGLATLATLTGASVAAIVSALALLIKGFAELIPGIVNFIVELGLALVDGIVKLVPPIVDAVAKLVIALLNTLTTYLPDFITKGTELIMQLLDGMGTAIPTLIEGAIGFITDLISGMAQGIRDNGPELIGAMMELMGEMLILVIEAGVSLVTAMFGWIPGVSEAAASVGTAATDYIRDNFKAVEVGSEKGKEFAASLATKEGAAAAAGAKVGKAGQNGANTADTKTVGSNKGSDFANALGAKQLTAQTAGSKVGNAGKSGANSANLRTVGGTKGQDFASGLQAKVNAAKNSGTGLANGGKAGAGSVSLKTTGENFGAGFAGGISNAYDSVVTSAKNLAKAAADKVKGWLDIRSPSRVTRGFGMFFGEGLALGIDDKIGSVTASAKDLALNAVQSLNTFLEGFRLPEEDNELKFKAVVDYDKVDASKFGSLSKLSVQPDVSTTAGMVSGIVQARVAGTVDSGQNDDNSAIIRQQDEQIGLLREQNQLLSSINNKDNSVYLDGKAIYDNNKAIQNNQTVVRNIFKGVATT